MSLARRDAAAVAGLLLLVLLFHYPVVLFGETFFFRDVTFNHIPRKQLTAELLAEGTAPLWNPYLNLGEPLLANPNNVVVHPANLLFLVLPFFVAFNWAVVGEFLLAALSLYALCRRWGVRPSAALVAAAGYVLSGHLVSLGVFWNALGSAAPAPLALLAADVSARGRSVLGPLMLGAVWALSGTGGEPVVALTTVLLSAGYLLAVAEGGTWRGRLASAGWAVLRAALWAAGFAAVQILPTLEFVAGSPRGAGLSRAEVTGWSLHPASLLEVLVPGLFGDPTMPRSPDYWGMAYHNRGMPYILSIGVAKVTLVLALIGALSRGRRNRYLLIAGALFALAALGSHTPLFGAILDLVPGASMLRFPVKLFFATNICLSALCGLGLERLLRGVPRPRRLRGILLAAAALAVPALYLALRVPDTPEPWSASRAWIASTLCLAAALSIAWLSARATRRAGLVAVALVALSLAELWPAHQRLNPTAPVEEISRPPRVAATLKKDPGLLRIHRRPNPSELRFVNGDSFTPLRYNAFHRETLFPNYGMAHGLAYGLNATSDQMDWPAARLLGSYAESLPPDDRLRILGMANIKYVLSFAALESEGAEPIGEFATGADHRLSLFRNRHAMPRAYFVGGARRVDDLREACLALGKEGFDPRQSVILSGTGADRDPVATASRCRVAGHDPNQVVIEMQADGPGWLVLLDAFAPGWRATVDGEPVEIARANVCFRAVEVGAGEHTIEFRYRPWSVLWGAAVTALVVLAALLRLALAFRGRRRFRTGDPGRPLPSPETP